MARRVTAAVALAVLASGCAVNPATGERQFTLMSEAQEIQIGQEQDAQVRKDMGVYDDATLQQYVSSIGLKLAQASERPNLPWHFTVVDSPAVNAFALPGGYIYLTRGILPYLDDEAQLAGVLGHEIGHVTARHAASQYTRQVGAGLGLIVGSIFVPEARPFTDLGQAGLGVLFLKYGRDDELQADSLGVRYASRAGWNPDGVPAMLTTLARIEDVSDSRGVPNWLQTHPPAPDRVERVQAAVSQAESGAGPFVDNREAFLPHLDGLMYGDNPAQGIVRGSRFLHPGLLFAIDFPEGWGVTNQPTQVVAEQAGGKAIMLLQTVDGAGGRQPRDVAQTTMQNAGFRAVSGSSQTIHGLDAYIGLYSGTMSDVGEVSMRAAHIAHNREMYFVAGLAPSNSFDTVATVFATSIQSFRPLSRAEAEGIHASRIDFYTARAGDTWQSIADGPGGGVIKATTLAIMNGHDVNSQPRSGERLKVAVPG
jgi:predicted Zn-dependent protease